MGLATSPSTAKVLSEVPHSQYEPSLHGCGCVKTPSNVLFVLTPSMQNVAGRQGKGRKVSWFMRIGDERSSLSVSSALRGSGVRVLDKQKCPAGQRLAGIGRPSWSQTKPGGQGSGSSRAKPGQMVPNGHFLHVDCPYSCWKSPGTQGLGSVLATPGQYVRLGQGMS